MIYDIFEKKTMWNKKFDKATEFISHCKLFSNFMVYVEENKNVKLLNYLSNEIKTIYSHKYPVMALDFFHPEEITENNKENTDIILQIEDGNSKKSKEGNPLMNKISQFAIFSIDYNGNLIVFKNDLIIHNFNVLGFFFFSNIFFNFCRLSNFPENLKKQKLLFDMGYPYYIKSNGISVAFTTDFGLCMLNLGSKL